MRILPTPVQAPAVEPVTVDECKLDARIDGSEFDAALPGYIAAARLACEHEIGQRLITQTWRAIGEDWPACDEVIALLPAQSATVAWWDGAAWQTLDTALHQLEPCAGGVLLLPAYGATWPALGARTGHRVRVDVVVGFGPAPADVPDNLKRWIRAHVASAVDQPAAMSDRPVTLLPHLAGLLDPHRIYAR